MGLVPLSLYEYGAFLIGSGVFPCALHRLRRLTLPSYPEYRTKCSSAFWKTGKRWTGWGGVLERTFASPFTSPELTS